MHPVGFSRLASLAEQLESTTKRTALASLVADFLRSLQPEEIPPGVRLLIGRVFPEWDGRALNMSWRAASDVVRGLADPTEEQRAQIGDQAEDTGQRVKLLLQMARTELQQGVPLTLLDVYEGLEQIAEVEGQGSWARKGTLLRGLLLRASPVEAKYIVKAVIGEMRHGVSEGIMLQAIAQAAGMRAAPVRRANMLWGDLGEVARAALGGGIGALQEATLKLFRPLKPMLAQTADSLSEAFERYEGHVALEYKLDGARVQIHKQGQQVRIYSRSLSEVTTSLPEVVEATQQGLAAEEAVVEGEAVGVDGAGRPLPFQHLMRRFRRVHDVAALAEEIPVQLRPFDLLYLDGESLVDLPNRDRWERLERVAGGLFLVPRIEPVTVEEGEAFAEAAHRAGHEGTMAKDLRSGYSPGVRGRSWLKLKHVLSLDCVIVAADWGYGRRHGWLSNYHLSVRDESDGSLHVVGKTFKGLTDEEFRQTTERLLELQVRRMRGTVHVQPRVVVEVLFNEIQESSQYPSGFALRFARIHRIRDDKTLLEVDTLRTLRMLYEEQFRYKGRMERRSSS
jgi:DNA ligase-1